MAGHRRIGILGGDFDKSYTSHQRFLGCEQSFSEHGAVLDVEHCYEKARFSFGSACRAMKRLIGKFPDVTAVFAMSDVMAIGAIRALRDLGYRVPEDVSVIGFDNYIPDQFGGVGITTYEINTKEMAKRTVHIILHKLRNDNYSTGIFMLPGKFVERDSVRRIAPAVPFV